MLGIGMRLPRENYGTKLGHYVHVCQCVLGDLINCVNSMLTMLFDEIDYVV